MPKTAEKPPKPEGRVQKRPAKRTKPRVSKMKPCAFPPKTTAPPPKAEAKRSEAENNRIANENARKAAELERSAAETERAAAETERSRIFRGEVELPTASTPNDDPVDFAVESGWYFYKGGILVVSAALSGSAGSEYGTIEQAALLTDGTIIHRTCTVSAGAKNWSAWA